jgi:hypothetical protein
MILATLLALSTPQVAQPAAATEPEDIVVLARLRKVRFDYRVKDGAMSRCRVTRSTGDAALDELVCDTARICVGEGQAGTKQLAACLKERRYEILDKHAALLDAAETEHGNASN